MIVEGGSDIFEFIDTDANFLDSPLVWQPPERMSPNLPGFLRLQGTSPPRACNQRSGAEAAPSSLPVQSSWPRRLTGLRSTKEVWQNPFSTCQRPPSDLDPNTAPHFVTRSACQRLLASVRTNVRRPVRLYHTTREVRTHCRAPPPDTSAPENTDIHPRTAKGTISRAWVLVSLFPDREVDDVLDEVASKVGVSTGTI